MNMQGVSSCKTQEKVPANPLWNTRFKSYTFAEELAESLRNRFLNAEELLMQSTVLKNSRSTAAGIFHLDGKDYFIKRNNVRGLSGQLRHLGSISRAERNRIMAAELEKVGIRTPKVYMALDTSPYGLPGMSYLITECFKSPITVAGNMRQLRDFYGSNEEFIRHLTALACKLHNNGIEHGDFKITNILALRDAADKYILGVFDLDGCKKYDHPCSVQVRIRELARVASAYFIMSYNLGFYEDADEKLNRKLFLTSYAEQGGIDLSENMDFHRRIERFFADDVKHKVRND